MWLSQQHIQPRQRESGHTGTVTAAGDLLAVRLDHELRGLTVYGPAGYRWTPAPGDRVLVLKGEGDIPIVAGTDRSEPPAAVTISAGTLALEGAVTVNGTALEDCIRLLVRQVLEETE